MDLHCISIPYPGDGELYAVVVKCVGWAWGCLGNLQGFPVRLSSWNNNDPCSQGQRTEGRKEHRQRAQARAWHHRGKPSFPCSLPSHWPPCPGLQFIPHSPSPHSSQAAETHKLSFLTNGKLPCGLGGINNHFINQAEIKTC